MRQEGLADARLNHDDAGPCPQGGLRDRRPALRGNMRRSGGCLNVLRAPGHSVSYKRKVLFYQLLIEKLALTGSVRHCNSVCVERWRSRWDSNPRDHFWPGGFQDRCHRPLGHCSAAVRKGWQGDCQGFHASDNDARTLGGGAGDRAERGKKFAAHALAAG